MRFLITLFEADAKSESQQLDPRSKLMGIVLFNGIVLFIKSLSLLFICLLVLTVILLYLRWNVFRFLRVGLILSLSLFIVIGFLFWTAKFQNLQHSTEIVATMRAILRFIILATSGLWFMFTTSVSRFIYSLEKMRLPFPLIFVLSIAIRFFPHCLREMELIMDNARSRGVWGWALILHPYRSARALLFPLLVRSLKKADALALAATIRGFGGPTPRSSRQRVGFQQKDFLFLFSILILSLSLFWADRWIMVQWG